jgi:hypothetical protein
MSKNSLLGQYQCIATSKYDTLLTRILSLLRVRNDEQMLIKKGESLGLLLVSSDPAGIAVREDKVIRNSKKVKIGVVILLCSRESQP